MKIQEQYYLASLQFIDNCFILRGHSTSTYTNYSARYFSKGGDYKVEEITGREVVLQNGGK